MRLMLGNSDSGPTLLVTVYDNYDPLNFKFWVVNGVWNGVFTNGHITVLGPPSGDWSDLDTTEILTDNQKRLRGDYNDVFNNFNNLDYVGPEPKVIKLDDMDNDIPF